MTERQYKRATQIENQLGNIDSVLNFIEIADDFTLDPPTRDSGFTIEFGECGIRLNQGDVVCIKQALESKKIELQEEFERL